MIINYLRTTLRFLRKNKLYTIINVAGLTLGITVFTIISLLVLEETSFDTLPCIPRRNICRPI